VAFCFFSLNGVYYPQMVSIVFGEQLRVTQPGLLSPKSAAAPTFQSPKPAFRPGLVLPRSLPEVARKGVMHEPSLQHLNLALWIIDPALANHVDRESVPLRHRGEGRVRSGARSPTAE
jgi:hypothetical protein